MLEKSFKQWSGVLAVLALLALSACSTVKVPMTIKHPAEINMSNYQQIAIGEIKGSHGRDFAGEIKNRLVESGRFKVVDRSRLDAVMKELNLSSSDLTESKNRAKLGKLLNASALIAGYLDGKYKESTSSKKSTCYKTSGKKTVEYACTVYYRKGTYSTSGSVDVVDVQTGELLRSKSLSASYVRTTNATNARPEAIDKDSLYTACLQDGVKTFMKSINPWDETVMVPFKKDGDIPALERGINQAKMGEIEEAISIFAKAAQAAQSNAEIEGDSIAVAYWNLGLAYKYTWQLDKAIDAFKKAYSFDADDDYIREKKSAEKMKAEKRKLEDQKLSLK